MSGDCISEGEAEDFADERRREEAAARLVRRALEEFEGPLTGYAQSIVRDPETARDVVQDTFLKLWRQEPAKLDGCLKPWLYTVCRNRALDILRKEKRMTILETEAFEKVAGEGPDPGEQAERRETQGRALALLERLPENQRDVIRLKFQGDLSYKEISEVTKLSVSNVGFLIHEGMKRLRRQMRAQLEADERAITNFGGERRQQIL